MGAQELPVLNRDAVAALLGVKPKTISTYLTESRPDAEPGRYRDHPFPAPDGTIGRAPWWHPKRKAEILAWAEARPGQGAGGGRPHQTRS